MELSDYSLKQRILLIEAGLARLRDSGEAGNLAELIATLHRSEIADLIGSLPAGQRQEVWLRTDPQLLAEVASDLPEVVLADVIAASPDDLLVQALAAPVSIDEKAALLRCASAQRQLLLIRKADLVEDRQLQDSLSYSYDAVGSLMDFEQVVVAADETVGAMRSRLEEMGDLPKHADKLFVTDADGRLCGILPLKRLLIARAHEKIGDRMVAESLHTLQPETDISDAAGMFERYDLVSAPVLDAAGKVCGRLTIDEIVAHLSEDKHAGMLNVAGVAEEYDLYAPLPRRLMHRGGWMLLNLLAAFLVSAVVGSFEDTIAQIVTLAALMPIVSSVAGSASMQTASVIIRALALDQIKLSNAPLLLGRELMLGLANGLVWGGLVGLFGYLVYADLALAAVLTVSQLAVFVFAAGIGFCVPLLVGAMRGDPALGAAVLVTVVTDCLAFLIFLGMATLLLV
ncbi:MAG: magnesium transporter [Betaproteobacteria bacterium]|nr:magnesium transporter [Betaproteobacteria bacterium]